MYRFRSKSISLLIWCYRLSIHRGRMKSILNVIRLGEHDHFVQLMYKLINGTPYLDITGQLRGVLCEILEKIYRDISGVHCIYRMAFHCLCELSLWLLLLILLYCESINELKLNRIELNISTRTIKHFDYITSNLTVASNKQGHSPELDILGLIFWTAWIYQ